jgi:hypothetical protein
MTHFLAKMDSHGINPPEGVSAGDICVDKEAYLKIPEKWQTNQFVQTIE